MGNQALERAKAAYGTGAYDDATIEFLFPEVKENKDEMIRKELINLLSIMADGIVENYTTIPLRDFIAYLEKQKPAEWSEEDEDFINMLILHFNYLIDKGGDSVETYKSYIERLKSLRPQPKQEWSEEDKEYLAACIDVIDNFYTLSGELKTLAKINVFRREYAEKLKSWLKSLPLNLKKKNEDVAKLCSNEWSEEDKKLLDFWLDVIDRNDWRMDENFCKASREFINRLKSLRPQPNQEWSEKDEDMLNAAIEMVENSNTIFCFEVNNHKVSNWLKSLPLNLKKKNEDVAKLCSNG